MRAAFPDSTYFCSDHDLLRFLRARHFDMPAACTMFSKYRNVVRPPPPPPNPTSWPNYQWLKRRVRYHYSYPCHRRLLCG